MGYTKTRSNMSLTLTFLNQILLSQQYSTVSKSTISMKNTSLASNSASELPRKSALCFEGAS
jgi:hypothetical protein